MRRLLMAICCVGVMALAGNAAAEEQDWNLGVQAYTFRQYTFFETVDILQGMGVHYVEAYPGQKIGGGIEGGMSVMLEPDVEAKVLAKLKAADVKWVAFGVTGIPAEEEKCREFFKRAKAIGVKTFTTEPDPKALPLLDKMCQEFDMYVALHNHPKPSRYWDPQVVLDACEGLSPRVGACADPGHWVRSGLDPLECFKKLEGRVIESHFGDLGAQRHDVPWGTGESNTDAMFLELKRQGFKGCIIAEYEHATPLLKEEVAASMVYAQGWSAAAAQARTKALAPVMVADVSEIWRDVKVDGSGVWTEEEIKNFKPVPPKPTVSRLAKGVVVTANGPGFAKEGPAKAFDGNTGTKYCVGTTAMWLQITYPEGQKLKATSYAITSANDNDKRDPKDWALLGSDDGEKWTELDKRTGEKFSARFQSRDFEISEPGAYRFYKLNVTANNGDVSSQVAEWEIIAAKEAEKPAGSAKAPGGAAPDMLALPGALKALAEKDAGYAPLLKPDLANASFAADAWTMKDGTLAASKPQSNFWTKQAYGDFIIDLEFKCTGAASDGGVFLRCGDTEEWLNTAIEVQTGLPYPNMTPNRSCGSVVGCQTPFRQMLKADDWNRCTVIAKGALIFVILNGEQVVGMDLELWTEAGKNPDGSTNPFKTAYREMPRKGLIGFQCWKPEVQYRAIRVKEL